MSTEAGAAVAASEATSTPSMGGDAHDAIETELADRLKADGEREAEAKPEATTEEGDADTNPDDPKTEEAKPAEKPAEKVDPKTARGLEAIHREKVKLDRDRQQIQQKLDAQISDLEQSKAKHEASIKAVESFKSRITSDPVGAVLDVMGDATPEQLDYIARQFYARSKAASNPEMRAAAERERANREAQSRSSKVEEELAALKAEREQEKRQAAQEEFVREYLAEVEQAVGDDTPLLSKAIKKNPKVIRAELRQVAEHIAKRTGTTPSPSEVTKGWETVQRAQLEARGIDVEPLIKPAAPQQKPNPVADEKKRPVTTPISSELGTQTRPRSTPPSQEELDREIERELAARMRGDG
jgi:hypothetical protein